MTDATGQEVVTASLNSKFPLELPGRTLWHTTVTFNCNGGVTFQNQKGYHVCNCRSVARSRFHHEDRADAAT